MTNHPLRKENWKKHAETGYWISDKGRVKRKKRGPIRKSYPLPNGIWITEVNGTSTTVAKLVLETFTEKPTPKAHSRNISGDQTDLWIENLEWQYKGSHREKKLSISGTTLCFRISKSDSALLERVSKETGRKKAAIARDAVSNFLAENERRKR